MTASILHPSIDLVSAVADQLVAVGNDYSANLVLFPGKRPAHYLRKELGQRVGSGYIPPHIMSMDGWIDELHAELSGHTPLDALDAVALLYDIHCSLEQRLGRSGFTSLDLFFSVGLRLFRDLEEMTIEMISPHQVQVLGMTAEGGELGGSHDRIMHIAAYAERFYAAAAKEGRATRALRYRNVADGINTLAFDRYHRIVVAGFFTFTASERLVMQSLASRSGVVMLFQDGPHIDDRIEKLGLAAERVETTSTDPAISFLACPDVHGQTIAVGDQLADLCSAETPDERMAIVLPSAETLFPLVRHALSGWDERSYNITLGYPLVRTPIFGFFRALAALVTALDGNRIYLPSYLAFILHPYTKNIFYEGSAEVTRILFHTIEDSLRSDAAPAFMPLHAIEAHDGILSRASERLAGEGHAISASELGRHLLGIHERAIVPFLQVESIRDFAEKCMALVEYLHDHTTAQLHPLFYPYVETVVEALDDVRNSALGKKAFHDAASYFSFFERYLTTRSVPFEGTPLRGLQVMGVLETRGIRFDRVFLLDANEDILPEARRDDSFIPAGVRQMLGMPTHRDRDDLAHYYFSTLVQGAKEITICFLENDRRQRSRFVEQLLWEQEKRQGRVIDDDVCRQVRYRVRLDPAVPQAYPKSAVLAESLRKRVFSASSLDRYLACPLRFYYHDVLRLRPREEKTGELERSDIGLVVHDVLKVYLAARSGSVLAADAFSAEEISSLVEDHFVRRFGENPFGAAYLQMRQVQRRLAEFVTGYLMPLADRHEFSVLRVEDELKEIFHGYKLQGRLDAVFMLDGRTVIVDFKTSANRRNYAIALDKLDIDDRTTWSRAVGSLQMPLYRRLFADAHRVSVDDVDARYLLLGTAHIDAKIEIPLFEGQGDPGAGTALIERFMKRILDEIVDAEVPFYSPGNLKAVCPFCDYSSICGTQWMG